MTNTDQFIYNKLVELQAIQRELSAQLPPSRELSVTLTHIDTARLWLDEDRWTRKQQSRLDSPLTVAA